MTVGDPMACGKRLYESRREAKRIAQRTRHSGVRPYHCPDCGFWHLGHIGGPVIRGLLSRAQRFGKGAA